MPEPKSQFRYGLFVHRGDGRYVWDERLGKIYYRRDAAEKAADAMNAKGQHGGMVVARSESATQHYPRRNPRRSAVRAVTAKRKRNPSRGTKYETTLNGVRVLFFQGYAEDVRYQRAADGQAYSHVVETDAAELYLCEHPTYGRCLMIVDPSGKTPLWN